MTTKRFAFIKDGSVFNIFDFDEESSHPSVPRLIAGLSSDPYMVRIPSEKEKDVFIGSTWDGVNFYGPN